MNHLHTVRRTLAQNDSIHKDVMLKLAQDSGYLVRSALAQNDEIGNAVVGQFKKYKNCLTNQSTLFDYVQLVVSSNNSS